MARTKKLTLRSAIRTTMMVALFPVLLTGLSACSGSDGAPGPQGATGPAGPAGPAGPVTTTNASCAVCHSDGKAYDINYANQNSVHNSALLPQATATINSVVVDDTDPANPIINTTFTPARGSLSSSQYSAAYVNGLQSGIGVDANMPYLRFAYARLTAGDAHNSPQWIRYSSGDRNGSHLVDNLDGTFTMSTTIAGADYDATATTRLLLLISAASDDDGTALAAPKDIIYNFVPNGDAITVTRDLVSEDACLSCHGNVEGSLTGISDTHSGSRYKLAACAVCHADRANSASGTQGISVGRELVNLIHQVHMSLDIRDDWTEVTYPDKKDGIPVCTHCHRNNDDSSVVAGADNWKTKPSMQACKSCHSTIVFDGVTSFVGLDGETKIHALQTDNTGCAGCHQASGGSSLQLPPSMTVAHDMTTGSNYDAAADPFAPEFDVVMTMDTPVAGYYIAGDTPIVTVTLKNHKTGLDVDPAVYTTPTTDASSAVGAAGGGLSNATLYVYGPRNWAAPVLTLNASADRGESLLLPSTDPNVTADADGYHYKLQPIPADMPEGTYMAGTQMTDYGFISATDWKTTSSAAITFQIGTNDVTPKASGDACLGCHGETRMHNNNDGHPHNVPFDTDYCDMCHDTTGLHGNPIANRVHAVHSRSSNGDLGSHASYDWSEVTFPQKAQNCVACHNSGGTGFLNDFMLEGCFGCHPSTDNASWDHMLQMGGVATDQ